MTISMERWSDGVMDEMKKWREKPKDEETLQVLQVLISYVNYMFNIIIIIIIIILNQLQPCH